MADFYPVLSRAVAGLPVNTFQTRHAIYDRARGALLGQLRSIQPAMSEADLARQSDALSLAAARIEAEYDAAAKAGPSQVPVDGVEQGSSPTNIAATPPLEQAQVADTERHPPPVPEPAGWDEPVQAPRDAVQAPRESLQMPGESLQMPRDILDESEPRPAAPSFPAEPAAQTEASVIRPRVSAPPKPVDASGRRRTMIVGGGVGLAVLGIAIAAYVVNTGPQVPQGGRVPASGTEQRNAADQRGGKLGERVGQDAPAQANPANRPELPVAQRAVLYIESPDDPQKPVAVGGRVAWRLDSENIGQGRPVETVVRATVEIPEAGMTLTFTIRRNTDAAFPASHILGMRFVRTTDDGNGVVKEAGVPQFKADESERGAPLSAITSSLGDNLFVSALSNVPIEIERNVDLMTRRNWVDIPVRFASGKRGIIAFEKGFSGDQTITDAFNRWR